jgi:hypothetical protein
MTCRTLSPEPGAVMKTLWASNILTALTLVLLLTTPDLQARIRFNSTQSIQIDLEKLELDKAVFFTYVAQIVREKPFGLQAYGQVPFRVCDLKLKDRKLFDYETIKGRNNRFISNPSCDQIVIRRLLETNYRYQLKNLSPYDNRKCVRSVESIFRPLLEYYTIHYEEKTKPTCILCDEKERVRMEKIAGIQDSIIKNCRPEQEKVIGFLNDLDETIEKAFQSK